MGSGVWGRKYAAWLAACGVALLLAACGPSGEGKGGADPSAKGGPPPAMPVTVAQVVERTVSDWEEFVGRVEAVERVELRPRVSGYLQRVAFTQGSDVGQGAVMFEIDPELFQVEVRRAEAELSRARTRAELARNERLRTDRLVESGAVSRQESDERIATEKDAEAAVRSAEASLASAKLNLGYTRVLAPISGRSGRAEVTAGNFVTAGQTVLTTLVRVNPVYVTFEADERVYLRFSAMVRKGSAGAPRRSGTPVEVGLADEQGYSTKGTVEFVDNRLNPQTGTIYARAVIDNREGRFTPGLFARVRVVGGGTYPAALIDDRAVGTDQNRRFVLVVGADGGTQYREVRLGPVYEGLRVVREGVKAGETIIVDGLQRVRPGMKVKPTTVPMDPKERPKPDPAAKK
ncbi:MAG: efflux RND transporter periplasmic adaptor subunit [bacterium]|jgi:RND family efflux transporter MFP subunit|nr:efflux RND transporter periplasmic adaptor subunit [Betaproteobacteria bacterium]